VTAVRVQSDEQESMRRQKDERVRQVCVPQHNCACQAPLQGCLTRHMGHSSPGSVC
jgi:hypothetical protein